VLVKEFVGVEWWVCGLMVGGGKKQRQKAAGVSRRGMVESCGVRGMGWLGGAVKGAVKTSLTVRIRAGIDDRRDGSAVV
jgi:hypothetical protein